MTAEKVTVVITKPNAGTDTWTTSTLANGTFTLTEKYGIKGNYAFTISIPADSQYAVAQDAGAFVVA